MLSTSPMYSKASSSSLLGSAPFKEDYPLEYFNHLPHPPLTQKEHPIDLSHLFTVLLKASELSPSSIESTVAAITSSRTLWQSMTVTRRQDLHLRPAETGMPIIYEANQRGEEFLALKKEGEMLGKGEFRTTQVAIFLSHPELQVIAHLTQRFKSEIAKRNSNDELHILHKIRQYQLKHPKVRGIARFLGYTDYQAKTSTSSSTRRISDYDDTIFKPNKHSDTPSPAITPSPSIHEKRALAFKLYSGGTLSEKIGSLDLLNRLKVAKFLLQGLTYLHSIGIFHSDLKMENILLDMSSDSKTVLEAVISDFGFSIDFNSLGVHFYKNGDFKCRAPEFMKIPPGTEIDRNFAFSGDVYSMGLIIRSLICEWLPSFHPISKLTERMSHPDPTQRITAREANQEFKNHFVKFIPDIQPSVDLSSSMRSSSSLM